MSGPPQLVAQGVDKVSHCLDLTRKVSEITAQLAEFMRVARTGGRHRMGQQELLCLRTRFPGDVVTDQFECVENGPMLGHDRVKRLVPSKRMRGHDGSLMALHRIEQFGFAE